MRVVKLDEAGLPIDCQGRCIIVTSLDVHGANATPAAKVAHFGQCRLPAANDLAAAIAANSISR
jgi:hypothetical protein